LLNAPKPPLEPEGADPKTDVEPAGFAECPNADWPNAEPVAGVADEAPKADVPRVEDGPNADVVDPDVEGLLKPDMPKAD
jgi:hypothetical protein